MVGVVCPNPLTSVQVAKKSSTLQGIPEIIIITTITTNIIIITIIIIVIVIVKFLYDHLQRHPHIIIYIVIFISMSITMISLIVLVNNPIFVIVIAKP